MIADTLAFTKGHGTQNDFVLFLDEAGVHDVSVALVRALCDRRAGIGADGLLRAVRAGAIPEGVGFPADMWFMDYRNADGSVAEMCGNGSRVFAAFLAREVGADVGTGLTIATRAGERKVTRRAPGVYAVEMGRVSFPHAGAGDAKVVVGGIVSERTATSVDVGNPHVVVALDEIESLLAADLTMAPNINPRPPDGANVELVVVIADHGPRGRLRMRVHERGVGETRSCGTGACAAAAAARAWAGPAGPSVWDVEVPGGSLVVRFDDDNVELEGPAVLVADGVVNLNSLIRDGA